ncbi:unnamed protein product [Parnassius mnemosyne]|uniref:CCHC-type domain-containing protein n=1 Tax=Parnassius mnemosyne TaxID=213953 RepID=A0AAV1LDK9_9NEOP
MNVQGAHYDNPEQVLNYFRYITGNKTEPPQFPKRFNPDMRDKRNDSVNKYPNQSMQEVKSRNNHDYFNNKRTMSHITCFNCGEVGHTVLKCTKEILRCNKCKRHGHKDINCNSQNYHKPNNTNREEINNISKTVLNIDGTVMESNQKYFKDVKINDIIIKGYIDFGSECTLLSDKVCKDLNLKISSDELPILRGFGNSAISPIGKAQVRVRVDFVDIGLIAYVVPASLLPAEVLIGQSLSEHPTVRVFKTDKELTLYQITANKSNLLVLTTVDDYMIKNDTVIEAVSVSQFTGFVSIASEIQRFNDSQYLILPGVYAIYDGIVRVVVISLCDKPFSLKKGKIVARGVGIPKQIFATNEENSYVVNVRLYAS